MKIVEVLLPKDLRDTGMPSEEICAMAYKRALDEGAQEVQITQPGGRSTKYPLSQIRTFLRKSPWHRDLVGMGATLGMTPVEKFVYRRQQFQKTRGLYVPA